MILSGRRARALALALFAAAAQGARAQATPAAATAHPSLWPTAHSPATITDPATEARIDRLMAAMSLEEKVGQTIVADISAITPDDLRRYPLGGVLAGGSSAPNGDNRAPAADWLSLIRAFHAQAVTARPGHEPIPLMFGIDAVHGHNKIKGATLFPHNIGLGATRDPDLVGLIGEATAEEVAATGADWTFAPTLAVPRDIRWGRTYEGYAEEPAIVASYAGPMTIGLQGALLVGRPLASGHVIGAAKHFLGDGGTADGVDQGDARLPEADLIRIHAQGYVPAIDAGVLTVMASFSSWNGEKDTGNGSLLTDVLKGRLGFEGFVVSDWNAHAQLPGCVAVDCPRALLAGVDMVMAPDSWKGLFEHTVAEVKKGDIPMARLDDAVRRILRVKFKAGLFDGPSAAVGRLDWLGSPAHRALARRAVRESLVLMKNDSGVLPIRSSAHVLVAGEGADDIGRQSGGWTLNWQGQGNRNTDFPNGQSIWAGIDEAVRQGGGQAELAVDGHFKTRPDIAIVVFGESPYAEFQGDIQTLEYSPGDARDLALMQRLKAQGIPVVSVFLSGRPLWANPQINASDAFVAAWLPGTEGGGVADVLIGKSDGAPRADFSGRLSYSWPKRADRTPGHIGDADYNPQFPFGYGLSYSHGGRVGVLSENPGRRIEGLNRERYFIAGHSPSPWTLSLDGAVTGKAVDAGAQENARRLDWSGAGAGRLVIFGPTTDLSRQMLGDMALLFRYRVLEAPSAPVRLGMACGSSCAGAVDVTGLLTAPSADGWRTWKVKLSCLRDAGADMRRVTSPLVLSTSGRLSLEFTEARLAANDGDAICPPREGAGVAATSRQR
jgi:beta-glucosidase